jgi:antitoxin Phd
MWYTTCEVKNMEVSLESLISYEKLKTELDDVFEVVEKNGKVVILRDNEPMYILLKYDRNSAPIGKILGPSIPKITLQEAMKIVLKEVESRKLHAAQLSDEIYRRKLYLKKDGTQAKYNQVRARCGHYPDMFEALPGNIIQLKEGVE